ncbi:MAG TPA: hypothetical protein VGC41_10805 [Kofleriaceae bacterium]
MRWFRALGVRAMFGVSILVALLATHMAVSKPRLPFVVMGAIDRALSMPRAQPALVEAQVPFDVDRAHAIAGELDRAFAWIDGELSVLHDIASDALDTQLAQLATLEPNRRAAAIAQTMNYLVDARTQLVHTSDPDEFLEYDALCERLRDVRRLLA